MIQTINTKVSSSWNFYLRQEKKKIDAKVIIKKSIHKIGEIPNKLTISTILSF